MLEEIMIEESRILDLVARWEAARKAGKPVTPDELCSSCPDLLPAVKARLLSLNGSDYADSVVSLEDGLARQFGTNVIKELKADGEELAASDPTMPFACSPQAVESPASSAGRAFQIGQEVAGFRLLREIGFGGFGQVFEAEDLKLNRSVAIKFLLPQANARPEVREQFLTEARSMAALQHDHVVPIYQVGQVGENLFLVMPLLVGETLGQRLKREGSLPPEEVRRIGRELCLGLSALHAKGLIHRDVKPANLWIEITTGRVKVLDLGLADQVTNIRRSGSAGTPAYMSPEQVEVSDVDYRSDLFSVGAVLYECSTGQRAFSGRTITEVMEAVRSSHPVPVRDINPGVPTDLADLIASLLHKNRSERPASALEVAKALQASDTVASIDHGTRGNNYQRWIVGLLAMVACLAFGVVLTRFKPTAEPTVARIREATGESTPLAPLTIQSLEIIPWKIEEDRLREALPPLGARDHMLPTTEDAIEVVAKLSRPAYCYIILYRSDGQDYLLFPEDDTAKPLLTDQPRYPSTRSDVRYVLDDGPGIWAVAIIASDIPLPSYREWLEQRPTKQPWKPQPDPTRLQLALLDTGKQWRTLGNNRSFSRGERQFQMDPYQQQMDWLKQQVNDGAVTGIAFPVR